MIIIIFNFIPEKVKSDLNEFIPHFNVLNMICDVESFAEFHKQVLTGKSGLTKGENYFILTGYTTLVVL